MHVDETGWREDKKRAWLWTAVSALVTVFVIPATSGGAKVAKEVPGEAFANVLVTDRWSAYDWVGIGQRQICWAHLVGDFKKIAECGGGCVTRRRSWPEHPKDRARCPDCTPGT